MTVFEQSRYEEATILVEVEFQTNTFNGKVENKNPVKFLDDDRPQWDKSQFTDNITYSPKAGQTPDKIANIVYGVPRLWWIVAEFNDFVAQNPFIVFTGDPSETLTLPSPKSVFSTILVKDRTGRK